MDYPLGTTIYVFFTTKVFSTGVPGTLTGTPALSVLEENNATPITAGVSISVDRAGVAGLNQGTIVATTGNGFEAGKDYCVYISTGTVGVTSMVGDVVGEFSIEKSSALRPTTSARTLDVSATGEAGLDWANIGAPTTTQNLTGTTIKSSAQVTTGTAQAGGTASITLASAASSVDGTYDPALVRLTGGTGSGQTRLIIQYVGSTRVASVDRDWRTTPDATTVYEVLSSANLISTNEGLAAGGAASTVTLNATASAVDGSYIGETIQIRTGTGQDQSRTIIGYVGSTKVATVDTAWNTQPVSGSGYMIWPLGRAMVTNMLADTVNASSLAAAAAEEIADALLGRNVAGGSNTGRLVKEALYVARNKTAIVGGTMTVYGVDDTTPAFTAAVTTAAGSPISAIDPT